MPAPLSTSVTTSGTGIGPGGTQIPPPKDGFRYKVLAYQRVSREEAQTGGHTFETQSLRITEKLDHLLGKNQYELTLLTEDGVSGSYGPEATVREKRTRKVLKQVLQELHTRAYDVFIVYHSDRLARNTRLFLQILEDDILPNALFVSVNEEMDVTSSQGKLMATMVSAFNTMTRDRIVERNRDAAATRVQMGYYLGQVGYGWQWEPLADVPVNGRRRIRPVPEEGRWIIQMQDWFLGGWTPYRITAKLNEMGVPPPSATKPFSIARYQQEGRLTSGKWSTAVVIRNLRSPLHAGLLPAKGREPVQGEHYEFRFCDPSVREQVLETIEERKRTAPTNTGNLHNSRLLNGLVHCARCGKRMYPTTGSNGKYRIYRCLAGLSFGSPRCPGVSVREIELDDAITNLVYQVAEQPALRDLLTTEARKAAGQQDKALEAERDQLVQRVQDVETQFSRLLDALTRGVITDAEFEEHGKKLRTELTRVRAEANQVEAQLAGRERREQHAQQVQQMVLDFPRVWRHLGLDERREVMRHLLETLTIDKDDSDSGPSPGGTTATLVRVKIALLPEQTLHLMRHKAKRVEKPTTGLAGLTKRQLAYLYWIGEGKTPREAAEIMRVAYNTIRIHQAGIRKRLNIHDMNEAARAAKAQVQAQLSTLPLEGDRGPQAKHERAGGGGLYLSPKLMEVLPLYASGASTEEVAKLTGLLKTTVVGRRTQILEQTHSKTVFEACQKARKAGLL